MSYLHVKSHVVLLASQSVASYLFVWNFLKFKALDHLKKNKLRILASSTTDIKRSSADFHAVLLLLTKWAEFIACDTTIHAAVVSTAHTASVVLGGSLYHGGCHRALLQMMSYRVCGQLTWWHALGCINSLMMMLRHYGLLLRVAISRAAFLVGLGISWVHPYVWVIVWGIQSGIQEGLCVVIIWYALIVLAHVLASHVGDLGDLLSVRKKVMTFHHVVGVLVALWFIVVIILGWGIQSLDVQERLRHEFLRSYLFTSWLLAAINGSFACSGILLALRWLRSAMTTICGAYFTCVLRSLLKILYDWSIHWVIVTSFWLCINDWTCWLLLGCIHIVLLKNRLLNCILYWKTFSSCLIKVNLLHLTLIGRLS